MERKQMFGRRACESSCSGLETSREADDVGHDDSAMLPLEHGTAFIPHGG